MGHYRDGAIHQGPHKNENAKKESAEKFGIGFFVLLSSIELNTKKVDAKVDVLLL